MFDILQKRICGEQWNEAFEFVTLNIGIEQIGLIIEEGLSGSLRLISV